MGYNVYYGSESGFYDRTVSAGGATTVNVDNLTEGVTYYFIVTAYNSEGAESEPSNEATYSVPGVAPQDAPFVAQIFPDHSITLGWNPNPTRGTVGYYVDYGVQSGIYDQQIWVEADTKVDIYNLDEESTYYFAVKAVTESGPESALSPETTYSIPQIAPPQNAPGLQQIAPYDTIEANWNPSPSADIAGYRVYYGTRSGVYDNWVDAGNGGLADVAGLEEGKYYFFAVTAYSASGHESAYSAEANYFLPEVVIQRPPVVLSLERIPVNGFQNAFSVTATGPVPATWTLEGSSDLKDWHPLITGGNGGVNVTLAVCEKPALFFRINSSFLDLTLDIKAADNDRYPNSFAVSTSYYVPYDWTLEFSEDLKNWKPFISGFYTQIETVVVNNPNPALFLRLKGQ